MKIAKSKTRKYMTKKRVYRGGAYWGLFKSDEEKAAEKAAAAAKAQAQATKARPAAQATKTRPAAQAAEAAALVEVNATKTAAEEEATKAEAAKVEAEAAPRDVNKALKAAKAAKAAAEAAAAAAAAAYAYATAADEYAALDPLISTWKGEYDGDAAAAVGNRSRTSANKIYAERAVKKEATAATAATAAADAVEKEYVKNQLSQFSRTTLPFMTFLYSDASVPSESDLQAAYKDDKKLEKYQIASLDEVKMIDPVKYKRYLKVFFTPMFDEFKAEFETTMNKDAMLKRIEETEFKQEEVEFEGFLAAIIAIQEVSVEGRAAALPEALFEAFSKLSDPRYVMLIFESDVLKRNGYNELDVLSYSKINETNTLVNIPYNKKTEMDTSSINGYNSIYLWKLLSRNYYDFYSVIIDKMFTESDKITFEEFIKRYNEWTLKKSAEAKDDETLKVAYERDKKMSYWISSGATLPRRLYLRPFEELGYSLLLRTPIYAEMQQRDSDTVIKRP
jgi:hypothetical protein